MRVVTAGTGALTGGAVFILEDAKNPAECNPAQPAVPLGLALPWEGVGLGDHQRSHPTQTILCIYDPNLFLISRM